MKTSVADGLARLPGPNGGEVQAVTVGDVLFVPAGRTHRFTELSDDFATWVIFYGPEGGERP